VRRVASIALNTFRETVREKILYVVLIFGGIMFLSTYVLSPLSVGAAKGKIIMDVGLACISLLGVLTVIVAGSSLVHKEVDKKAIFMVLTRPVSRHEYLIGKFWGIFSTLALIIALMTVILTLMIPLGSGSLSGTFFWAIYMSLLEVSVICSIVIFFSAFTTPVLTSFFSVCIFIAGSLSGDLRAFARKFGGTVVRYLMEGFYYILPNLSVFNFRNEAVHHLRFGTWDPALATLYAAVYCSVVLYLACLVFKRREFS